MALVNLNASVTSHASEGVAAESGEIAPRDPSTNNNNTSQSPPAVTLSTLHSSSTGAVLGSGRGVAALVGKAIGISRIPAIRAKIQPNWSRRQKLQDQRKNRLDAKELQKENQQDAEQVEKQTNLCSKPPFYPPRTQTLGDIPPASHGTAMKTTAGVCNLADEDPEA